MTTLRRRTYEVLEAAREDDAVSRVVDCFLIVLITLNVLAVILESVSSLNTAYRSYFVTFEMISVAIFTVEYLLRVWSCVEHGSSSYRHPLWGRLRYMRTPMAFLDLLVILPVMGAGVRIQARDVMGHLAIPFVAMYLTASALLTFL